MVLVQVHAGDTVGTGWTYGSTACATLICDTLADVVTGLDPMDVGRACQAMVRAVRNDPRQGVAGYAISAVDVALWDLKARLLDLPLPLRRLLGAVRDEVPVYGSGGFTTYSASQLDAQLTSWLDQGIVAAVAAAHNLQISGHCGPHLHAHVATATGEPAPPRMVPRPHPHRGDVLRRHPAACRRRRAARRHGTGPRPDPARARRRAFPPFLTWETFLC